MKFRFKGIEYPNRSEWQKAIWADPESKKRHINSQLLRWKNKSNDERLAITKEMREAGLRNVTSPEGRMLRSKQATDQMNRQWSNDAFRSKMLLVRKEQANRPKEKKRLSNIATALWDGSRESMSAERKSRWANPEFKEKMMRKGFNRTGTTPWNKGLTKHDDTRIMAVAKKFAGRIPDYNKYRRWYEGVNGKILMRSSYEVAFAVWCDERKIEWRYESKTFHVGEGPWVGTSYTPDFYLPKTRSFIETKGRMSEQNAAKLSEFNRRYPRVPLAILGRDALCAVGALGRVA